jgi:cobalt-zinc-cadmium efflux system membrane fusion protein
MKLIRLYLLMIIPFVAALTACKGKAEQVETPSSFCLTDTLQKKAVIEEVRLGMVKNVVALSGKIEADEDKWVKVYPVVSGVVDELKVQLGDYVKKGQLLVVVRSSEIADYQNQLSIAASNVRITEKSLNDTKQMFHSGLVTEKEVIAAETDFEKAKSDLKRIQQTVSIYGAKGNAVQMITAPVSGYVIEKNVTDKMQYRVDGTQPFFTIANLDEVWVMANVFESDIAKIKTGYDADIKVIAYSDKIFTGKVDRIFSILDPQSRVMKVRIRIPNTGNFLKPEMFAQINIKYNDGSRQLPAVPAGAVIFDKNRNYVMVYKDKCNIEVREVEIYETIGDTTYIKSGLEPGEKIITRYQLLVYDALTD